MFALISPAALCERRDYFIDRAFDERTETPAPLGRDYKNEIGTRRYPWDLSFKDWFESPYAMPMRRYVLEERGIVPTVSYLGNFAANPSGGRARSADIASNVDMSLDADFGKLSGARELEGLSLGNVWSWRFGDGITPDAICNNFNVQQVDGDPAMRCQALYLSYKNDVRGDWLVLLKAGRFAAGDNFMVSPIYWLYQNNAFDGNPVGVFKQQRWSAYPGSTWAAFARVDRKGGQYFKAGAYKINTAAQDSPGRHGLDWSFSGDGVNANFELGQNFNHDDSGKSPASVSAGVAAGWYNAQYLASPSVAADFSCTVYLQADCMLINLGNPKIDGARRHFIERRGNGAYRDLRGLVAWGAAQFNPNFDTAQMPLFLSGGLLFNAPFKSRADDVICFGAAYGMFSGELPASDYRRDSFEIALELNYKFQVNRFFFLQPNIQYIVNTNGGEYPNAAVLGLQFGLNL